MTRSTSPPRSRACLWPACAALPDTSALPFDRAGEWKEDRRDGRPRQRPEVLARRLPIRSPTRRCRHQCCRGRGYWWLLACQDCRCLHPGLRSCRRKCYWPRSSLGSDRFRISCGENSKSVRPQEADPRKRTASVHSCRRRPDGRPPSRRPAVTGGK